MTKYFSLKFKFILLILIFLFAGKICYAQDAENLYKKIDLFSEVLKKINEEYVEDVDPAEIMDSAIDGALRSLDPYSGYMSPEIYQNSQTDTEGKFGGLGIEVGMEGGIVKVIAPIDDTPAFKAGVKAGDYIIKINGEQVQGKTLMEAVNLMRGPVGTDIEITIIRRGLKKAKNFIIKRDIIEIKSVVSKIFNENIGYFRLSSFNENSSDQLRQKIKTFEIILYNKENGDPTATGDSEIKIQYEDFNNTSNGDYTAYHPTHGCYSTIGM